MRDLPPPTYNTAIGTKRRYSKEFRDRRDRQALETQQQGSNALDQQLQGVVDSMHKNPETAEVEAAIDQTRAFVNRTAKPKEPPAIG